MYTHYICTQLPVYSVRQPCMYSHLKDAPTILLHFIAKQLLTAASGGGSFPAQH